MKEVTRVSTTNRTDGDIHRKRLAHEAPEQEPILGLPAEPQVLRRCLAAADSDAVVTLWKTE